MTAEGLPRRRMVTGLAIQSSGARQDVLRTVHNPIAVQCEQRRCWFQRLVREKFPGMQCAVNHSAGDGSAVSSPLKTRTGEDAWVACRIVPWSISGDGGKRRALPISHAVVPGFINPTGFDISVLALLAEVLQIVRR